MFCRYNIVFPCMMMSTLTVLVFCLPPDSGEKIALGVTVLLAFSVFMLAIAEKMPETSESIPLIGKKRVKDTSNHLIISDFIFFSFSKRNGCQIISSDELLVIRILSTCNLLPTFVHPLLFSLCVLPAGIYLTSVMAITCVSVIMTVTVLNFFYRGPTLRHVPVFLQK